MNIETKTVNGGVAEYGNFGWELTDTHTRRVGRSHHRKSYVLARDKNMPNYQLVSQLEGAYFDLKRSLKTYEPMEWKYVLLAFVIFVIPGILYVFFKSKQKKKIDAHNAQIQKQMNDIIAKVKPLL